MARYRPVDSRLWDDRKFLTLSTNGRMLWLFLLTCQALPIPGVIVSGEAAMAEQLGWPVELLREQFSELLRAGLKVRREGRVVWLERAISYQKPVNPNAVKAWAKSWSDLSDCSFKHDLWKEAKTACKSWNLLFSKLFEEPCRNSSPNCSDNSSPNSYAQDHYQEHEQEHEQDQKRERAHAPREPMTPAIAPVTAGYDPAIPGARNKLVEQTYWLVSDARIAAARKLGLPDQLPFPPITPASRPTGIRDLLDRVTEEGAIAPQVCTRVVAALIVQAEDKRSIEWLSTKAFTVGGWRTARDYVPGQPAGSRSPHVGRVEPLSPESYPEGDIPI